MFKIRINCCDGVCKTCNVHFTHFCDNACPYCIDKNGSFANNGFPDWGNMAKTIIDNQHKFNDVLILGGEPFLFPDDLYCFVKEIKMNTSLKIYITTGMPITVYNHQEIFEKILSLVDGLNISAHHYDIKKSDMVRGNISAYPRNDFYISLPYKNKIRINLNLVRGVLDDVQDINDNVKFYRSFSAVKFNELQNASDYYVSFEKLFKVKLKSPFSYGCQQDISYFFPQTDNLVLLKRSCFMVQDTLKATLLDGIKAMFKIIFPPSFQHSIVFEDGSLKSRW